MTTPPPTENPLLAAALFYASKGWHVAPLHTPYRKDGVEYCTCKDREKCEPKQRGKHPRTKNGLKDATIDPALIRKWWEMWPKANIAICTTEELIAVDVDLRDGGMENWEALVTERGPLPATVESITGSGGRHLLFRYKTPAGKKPIANSVGVAAGMTPQGKATPAHGIVPGVDVRGKGGYILAPPSLHGVTWTRYRWELSSDPADVELAEMPEWLASMCREEHRSTQVTVPNRPAPKRTSTFLASIEAAGGKLITEDSVALPAPSDGEVVREGSRNTSLFSLARSMRAKNAGTDAILAACLAQNAGYDPPLSEGEVGKIVGSATSKPPGIDPTDLAAFKAQKEAERAALPPAERAKLKDEVKKQFAEQRVATHKSGRAAAVSAMREQMGLPPDDKTPAATATMQRGDDAELAFYVLRTLQRGSPELIIWDGETLRRYDPLTGLWEALRESDYYCAAVLFAGCLVGPPDAPPEKLKPLKLSRAAISGSYEIAQNLRYAPDFFAHAPKGLLFNNGFVVVKDGKITLHPHSPAHRALHTMGFDWDPKARAPRWNEFMNGIFTMPDEIGNSDGEGSTLPPAEIAIRALDRDHKIMFVHEFVGASLIGEATDYAVAPILVGEGNNGKSTFIDTVKSLFPPKAVASIAPQQFDNPTYLAALRGVRLNSCAEMPPKDIVDNEAFKSVIAGDTKTVRHLYGHPFECTFEAGQMYAGNKLPGTSDMSEGFWRRVMPLLFARAFNDNDRILGLSRMLKEERPGIVRLALEAAARLQLAKKYTVPESAAELKKTWKKSVDQVAMWYEECARSANTDEQEAIAEPGYAPNTRAKYTYGVAALAAYESYAVWAKRNGHDRPLTSANFYPRMKKILEPIGLWKRKTLSVIYEIRLIELHSNVLPFQRSGMYR